MARSKRVELQLDTLKAVKSAKDLSKSVETVSDRLGDTARQGAAASRAIDDFGDQSSDAARAAAALDRQIEKLTRSQQELAIAQALTGQNSSKQMRLQEAELRRLTKNRKLFGEMGEEAAPEFATSFSTKLGPLLAKMPLSPHVLAAVGGLGVAVAPVLGAAISGAIIAGAAVGAAGIGVAIASQDTRVQGAAKRVGDHIKSQLQDAAVPFVSSTINALNVIDDRFAQMNGSIQSIMRNASRFLEPLADGVADFMEPVVRGIDALVAKASPVIEAIRLGLGEVGRAIGDVFESLADNGVEAGMAISVVFNGISSAVRLVGNVINGLTESFGWLVKVADKLGFLSDEGKDKLDALRGATDQMTGASKSATGGMTGFKAAIDATSGSSQTAATSLNTMAAATATADARIKELTDSSEALFSTQMSLDRANLAVKNGMATLAEELTHGTRSLSLNSVEGRKNRAAVLDQLQAIEALRQSRIKHGVSLDEAGRKYVQDIDGLRKSMRQAGFTKGQIDDLTGAYKEIPKTVNTAVSATGVQATARKLAALAAFQTALKAGTGMVGINKALSKDNADFLKFDTGGRTPNVGVHEPAGVVHGKEFVFDAKTVRNVDRQAPGFLEQVHENRGLPGYETGGRVRWPFPTSASMTRIPSRSEASSAVTPSGGRTSDWIVQIARMLVPGIRVLSKDRPGARTLSGNQSYHSMGRAVDFEPSAKLARLWNERYMSRTKELISPYQQYNIHNGRRRHWTGAIWNQHNFAGGNPHDHIAMLGGGMVREPVFGVGRSGRTYSFAENGRPERVLSAGQTAAGRGGVTINAPITVNGTNLNVDQVARAVSRAIGRTVDIYARGVGV